MYKVLIKNYFDGDTFYKDLLANYDVEKFRTGNLIICDSLEELYDLFNEACLIDFKSQDPDDEDAYVIYDKIIIRLYPDKRLDGEIIFILNIDIVFVD